MEKRNHPNSKHKLSHSKEYHAFSNMRERCCNKNNPSYKNYGARGIKLCEEWQYNPKAFIEYIKELPNYGTPTYSIDRIDNNGHYEPGNLRWASKAIQAVNSRKFNKINSKQSGYIGISWEPGYNKWRIRISVNGKRISLGSFETVELAVEKRNEYVKENNILNFNMDIIELI